MAGMLPGVEAARRRRFHQKSNHYSEPSPAAAGYSTRRSSFCLYVSSHDFHLCTSTTFTQRNQIMGDESRLGAEVREAKKRLDERLQAQWRSEITRKTTCLPDRGKGSEVEKVKKSGSKRLKWLKLRWKSPEEEQCAVCLEQIVAVAAAPETLMQLRCGHRFHTQCLLPWLEANAHCPCCRMEIPI